MKRLSMFVVAFSFLSIATLVGIAGDAGLNNSIAEMKVQLRLNAIESSKLADHYASLLTRQLSLQDSVRACMRVGDERLPNYQQALNDVRDDLEKTKKRLMTLETANEKLVDRIGKKNLGDGSIDQLDKINRNLEKIVDRLETIERRLNKMDNAQRTK